MLCSAIIEPLYAAQRRGAAFLAIDTSALSAGMAETCLAVPYDSDIQFMNPAGLGFLNNTQISINTNIIKDIYTAGSFSLAIPKNNTSIGLAVKSLGSGAIHRTVVEDDEVIDTGMYFSTLHSAVSLSAARTIGRAAYLGASGKFINETLDNQRHQGIGMDAGLMCTIESIKGLMLGVSLNNLGVVRSGKKGYALLQRSIGAGCGYRIGSTGSLIDSVIIAVDARKAEHIPLNLNAGVKINISNAGFISAGKYFSSHSKNFSMGMGIHINYLSFYYSVVPGHIFGTGHIIGINIEI